MFYAETSKLDMRKAIPSFISNTTGYRRMVTISRGYNSICSTSTDMIDVLDSSGNLTGEVLSRKEVHRLGKLHRAVQLYLLNEENKLLLQRRSELTDHYPSMLSISVTGHVDAGESSLEAVRRELREELGLNAENQDFKFLFSSRRDAALSPTYIDRQINDAYACWIMFEGGLLKSGTAEELVLVGYAAQGVAMRCTYMVCVFAEKLSLSLS